MFRKYPGVHIIIIIFIIFIGAASRFEVSNVRLSTKVVIWVNIDIFWSNGWD